MLVASKVVECVGWIWWNDCWSETADNKLQ